jgi:hypothetical protein
MKTLSALAFALAAATLLAPAAQAADWSKPAATPARAAAAAPAADKLAKARELIAAKQWAPPSRNCAASTTPPAPTGTT